MWDMVDKHKIQALFQMEQQSGIRGIALTHPKSVEDLAHLNSVIRLMAQEKGAETPLEKYARFKQDITLWYKEMSDYGLTQKEQDLLKPYLSGSYGICESQEGFMQLVQIPECGGFDLNFADKLRKSIAKKDPTAYEELTKQYFEVVKEKQLSKNLCNYVWNVLVATSRGYGFNLSHTLAYSLVALQEMNLAYKYPIIFWNCACLISDSGGILGDEDDEDIDEDEKNKNKSADYKKMALAIGKMAHAGIKVQLPDINISSYSFTPDVEHNKILFGLKGILNVGDDVVKTIIENRPYNNPRHFLLKVKPKKQAMISLIKGGAFDNMMDRKLCMAWYIWETCDKKSNLNLQNLATLMKFNLLPADTKEREQALHIYEFTRYLKTVCKYTKTDYKLDERAINFLQKIDKDDLIYNDRINYLMSTEVWKNRVYDKWMDVYRAQIAENKQEILDKLNTLIFKADWDKYCSKNNYSAWEMEVLCFYYHEHELANINSRKYGYVDFNQLPEEPRIERSFTKAGKTINIYYLSKICGTCIAKNKNKSMVTILTPTGVVNIKFRKEHFALYDKQISQKQPDGTKKIIEKSWFNRGNMIVVQGIRSGDDFIPKKYASTIGHQLYHIDEIKPNGDLLLRSERYQGVAEDEE